MTIYLIAYEHEYEGGNGPHYETYVDEDHGYFTDKAKAEEYLASLRAGEKAAHERVHQREVKGWETRQERRRNALAANKVLRDNGLPETVPMPWIENKPVLKPWDEKWSSYSIVEVAPA